MNMLLISKNQLLLDGLSRVLDNYFGSKTTFTQCDLNKTNHVTVDNNKIDFVLIDFDLFKSEKHAFQKFIRHLVSPVIILNINSNEPELPNLPSLEIVGYIPNFYTSEQLIDAIEQIDQNHVFIPESLKNRVQNITGTSSKDETDIKRVKENFGVTKRQYEVLKLMACGYSNKVIANMLCLTEYTIKSHVSALFQAMNTRNRTECVMQASSKGLIFLDDENFNQSTAAAS